MFFLDPLFNFLRKLFGIGSTLTIPEDEVHLLPNIQDTLLTNEVLDEKTRVINQIDNEGTLKQSALQIIGLKKCFKTRNHYFTSPIVLNALDGVFFTGEENEILALLGVFDLSILIIFSIMALGKLHLYAY